MSREERIDELSRFVKTLPDQLLVGEREKLISDVVKKLNIKEITNENLDFTRLTNKHEGMLLAEISRKNGQSLKIMAPPVNKCLFCKHKLQLAHNKPTQVMVHQLEGPDVYSKYSYRCKNCPLKTSEEIRNGNEILERQDIRYHVEKYGNQTTGWMLYKNQDVRYVRASNEVYIEINLMEMIISNLHHGWMSAESQAESYNETFRNHKSTKEVKKFLECNPGIGNHFNKKEDLDFPCSENYNETENRMLFWRKWMACGARNITSMKYVQVNILDVELGR